MNPKGFETTGRVNFVPPFPYYTYMQYLEHMGEYLRNKLLGYCPKATHMLPVIETTGFKKCSEDLSFF